MMINTHTRYNSGTISGQGLRTLLGYQTGHSGSRGSTRAYAYAQHGTDPTLYRLSMLFYYNGGVNIRSYTSGYKTLTDWAANPMYFTCAETESVLPSLLFYILESGGKKYWYMDSNKGSSYDIFFVLSGNLEAVPEGYVRRAIERLGPTSINKLYFFYAKDTVTGDYYLYRAGLFLQEKEDPEDPDVWEWEYREVDDLGAGTPNGNFIMATKARAYDYVFYSDPIGGSLKRVAPDGTGMTTLHSGISIKHLMTMSDKKRVFYISTSNDVYSCDYDGGNRTSHSYSPFSGLDRLHYNSQVGVFYTHGYTDGGTFYPGIGIVGESHIQHIGLMPNAAMREDIEEDGYVWDEQDYLFDPITDTNMLMDI